MDYRLLLVDPLIWLYHSRTCICLALLETSGQGGVEDHAYSRRFMLGFLLGPFCMAAGYSIPGRLGTKGVEGDWHRITAGRYVHQEQQASTKSVKVSMVQVYKMLSKIGYIIRREYISTQMNLFN